MRPTLPHPLREQRGSRARQRLRLAARVGRSPIGRARSRAAASGADVAVAVTAVREPPGSGSTLHGSAAINGAVVEPLVADSVLFDPAVARVREAGGPVDRACYTCQCGYMFVATVSTTVTCPHCGSGQAW
jgi:hypothetical protein